MAVEAELKLGIPESAAEQLLTHPLVEELRRGEPRVRELSNTYYDTPDLALLERGIGLRLRRSGDRWLQTVKTGGSVSGGLHRRQEWEMEVAGPALELARFDAPELAAVLHDPALQARLAPLFTTEFTRTAVELAAPGGTRLELALDRGAVHSERGSAPLSEVEIELLSGEVAPLFELGLALARDLPLTLEHRSKAARGYAFFRDGRAASAPPLPGLAAEGALADAWEALLQWGVEALQGAEGALLARGGAADGERLAGAVGALESLLDLLGPALPETDELRGELAWLARRVTPLRYWDALLAGGLGALSRHSPEVPGLQGLLRRCETLRAGRARELGATLRAQRYTLLLLRLGRWLACRPWRGAAAAAAPFGTALGAALEESESALRRRGRLLRELSPEAMRTLRDAARRQWHGSRWLAAARSGSEPWYQVTALGRLHEALDHLHGAERAAELLDELSEVLAKPLRGLLEMELRLCRRNRREAGQAAWERQREQVRFWRAGVRP